MAAIAGSINSSSGAPFRFRLITGPIYPASITLGLRPILAPASAAVPGSSSPTLSDDRLDEFERRSIRRPRPDPRQRFRRAPVTRPNRAAAIRALSDQ